MSAPEQIWPETLSLSDMYHNEIVNYMHDDDDPDTGRYTRTDVAQALVAAAYLDAANLHQSLWRETSAYQTDQIIKRTPTDAKAALDRLIAEAVKEALDSARGAVLAEMLFSDLSSDDDRAHNNAIGLAAQAIEALKGGEA